MNYILTFKKDTKKKKHMWAHMCTTITNTVYVDLISKMELLSQLKVDEAGLNHTKPDLA